MRRVAAADLDDLGREAIDEVAIVRHEDQRAAEVISASSSTSFESMSR